MSSFTGAQFSILSAAVTGSTDLALKMSFIDSRRLMGSVLLGDTPRYVSVYVNTWCLSVGEKSENKRFEHVKLSETW